jgi:predicted AlkP superfamily pyrophosphatase or phosphodiesterase
MNGAAGQHSDVRGTSSAPGMPRLALHAGLTLALCVVALVACSRRSRPASNPWAGEHGAAASATSGKAVAETPSAPLRLVVVVSIDQFPAEYLASWWGLFPEGGFRRMAEQGVVYSEAHQAHLITYTGPGHSVMLTGAYARDSGVVGNAWYDRAKHARAYCVEDSTFPLVLPGGSPEEDAVGGASPLASTATSVGDQLLAKTDDRAKVIALAIKDRGAIMMGGQRPTGAYWFYPRACAFITSRYYSPGGVLPDWLARFNASEPCKPFVDHKWEHSRSDIDYEAADRDDAPYEIPLFGLGRTFPHPIAPFSNPNKQGAARDRDRFSAVVGSPFGNDLLLSLAEAAIEGESLGADDIPDLLTISFSSNDYVGHQFGPNSQEVLDTTLRTDRTIAALLDYLDRRVGKDRYVLALTSDHGVAPVPEYLEAHGLIPQRGDHYRLPMAAVAKRVEAALDERFSIPAQERVIESYDTEPSIYLDYQTLARHEPPLSPEEVAAAAAEELARTDGIARVYTRDELSGAAPEGDRDALFAYRSFNAKNSGDVLVQLAPHWLYGEGMATSHGTPYRYDTHVPLAIVGRGIRPGAYDRPVQVVDLAPTIARVLDVAPPPKSAGWALVEAIGQ